MSISSIVRESQTVTKKGLAESGVMVVEVRWDSTNTSLIHSFKIILVNADNYNSEPPLLPGKKRGPEALIMHLHMYIS